MVRPLIKALWALWVTLTLLSYCNHTHPQLVYGSDWAIEEQLPPEKATPKERSLPIKATVLEEYVVVDGDTLGKIAFHYGTTWEQLWALNKDRIANPHLIYIGQRIRVSEKAMPIPPPMTREEKIDRLARFMFKTSKLNYMTKEMLEECLNRHKRGLVIQGSSNLDSQRQTMSMMHTWTRELEIWQLSEAIMEMSEGDNKLLYTLAGLAWQESHFVNLSGKHMEVSFYQFLPSTVKLYFNLDDIGLVTTIWNLKNDPKIATAFAILLIKEHKGDWSLYNRGENYYPQLQRKINAIRVEFTRR